jgi:hypothetical protein
MAARRHGRIAWRWWPPATTGPAGCRVCALRRNRPDSRCGILTESPRRPARWREMTQLEGSCSQVEDYPQRCRYGAIPRAAPSLRAGTWRRRRTLVGFRGKTGARQRRRLTAFRRAGRASRISEREVRICWRGSGPRRMGSAWPPKLGIASKVVFAGRRDDMPAVYASLDMVVLPSFKEAMPMCLLEALAAASPVVATRGRHSQGNRSRSHGIALRTRRRDALSAAGHTAASPRSGARAHAGNTGRATSRGISPPRWWAGVTSTYIRGITRALAPDGSFGGSGSGAVHDRREYRATYIIVACRNERGGTSASSWIRCWRRICPA